MNSNSLEVADIFRDFGPEFRRKFGDSFPLRHHSVMNLIEICRTSGLGGHKERCDTCREVRYSYNSCKNRHCPKCQFLKKEKWVEDRSNSLLPINYFHVVFTLPKSLRPLALRNQKVVYDILFRSVSETLKTLCLDSKNLGAKIGFMSILHTWSQTLLDHPHVHSVVSGGGLSLDEKSWVSCKGDFFLPVKKLSRMFRGKFLHYLKEARANDDLKFVGKIEGLGSADKFKAFISELYSLEWVVYCKDTFRGVDGVIKYLGRYTHRIAISNYRIKGVKDGKVLFSYRDSRDGNNQKLMVLDVLEFIRRFLLHVLPNKYVRIRYYGLFANKNRKAYVQKCCELLNCEIPGKDSTQESSVDFLLRITGFDLGKCPFCGDGRMVIVEKFSAMNIRGP